MQILITNDDGIDAPGIEALARVAARFGDVIVVAPDRAHSGCGHRVSSDDPFDCREVAPGRWMTSGTPADCVRIGLWHVAPQADLVLAGINHGANLGVDVFMSGTVAAVREAALLDRPSIALSHYRRREGRFDWPVAAEHAGRAIEHVLKQQLDRHEFWNINLPDHPDPEHAPDIVECPLCPEHLQIHFESHADGYRYRGDYHARPRTAGDDVDVCFSGNVAVTRLHVWDGSRSKHSSR